MWLDSKSTRCSNPTGQVVHVAVGDGATLFKKWPFASCPLAYASGLAVGDYITIYVLLDYAAYMYTNIRGLRVARYLEGSRVLGVS